MTLRIALFGAGRIGHVHAANIAANPDLELVVIADPFIEGAQRLAEANGAEAVASPDEVFARDDIDGIVIGSPTSTHVDLITRAVERGIPALCEKPIDLDIEMVRACKEKIGDGASKVMLGFNRRFDPSFAAINARVANQEIGNLEQLVIISRDPAPAPKDYIAGSGGIFRDMTIHDLDMARFFVPNIVEVTATGANVFSQEIAEFNDYDQVIVTLRGSKGELINIVNSRHCSYGYDQRLEAFGAEGMLAADNIRPTTVRKHNAESTEQADPISNFFLERYDAAYKAELATFAQGIRDGQGFSPSFEDGVIALELANACLESAQTGRTVTLNPANV